MRWINGVAAGLLVLLTATSAWAQASGPGIPRPVINGDCIIGSGGKAVWGSCGAGGAPSGSAGDIQTYATSSTFGHVTPGTGVATALAVNVGSAGAVLVNGGALGTPLSGTLSNATGLPVGSGISGFGTGIATALAINVGSAGAPVLFNGALGTPSSGVLTNTTINSVAPMALNFSNATIQQNLPVDGGSHAYTVLSSDLTKQVILASPFTSVALPQATGSFAAPADLTICSLSRITVTSTTSTVGGIAGATGITMGSNQCLEFTASGGNWGVSLAFGTVLGSERDVSGTTDTLLASDCGQTVAYSNAGAVTVTIPAAIVPVAGTTCNIAIRQDGAGAVSVNGSAVSAATLVSAHSYTKTSAAHAVIGLELTTISATTTAVLTGDGA